MEEQSKQAFSNKRENLDLPLQEGLAYHHLMNRSKVTSSPARRVNAGEAWGTICRLAGYDPKDLPNASSLPPWTEEEAAAFERAINETCEQIEEP